MTNTPISPDVQEIVKKGQELYNLQLKGVLEPDNTGKYAVIDVDSGEYFLGDTREEAVIEARKKYPKKVLYVTRIGGLERLSFHHAYPIGAN